MEEVPAGRHHLHQLAGFAVIQQADGTPFVFLLFRLLLAGGRLLVKSYVMSVTLPRALST
jgi:hypothetical protein